MNESKPANLYTQAQPADRLVYLFSSDYHFASYISQQITHFGYIIQHVRDIKSLSNVSTDPHLVAILVDIPAGEHQNIENNLFAEISKLQLPSRAIIFISEHDDQVVRLKSIQAGGTAFFTKPVNIVSLVDQLDALNRNFANPQSFRVLIVEDQNTIASYYQMVLKMVGMDAQIATEANNVLTQVREFHPDLILMDTFMAAVNTADLAKSHPSDRRFRQYPHHIPFQRRRFWKAVRGTRSGRGRFSD